MTTPQDVAIIDVRKEVSFCKKTELPVLGVVENMSGLQAPLAAMRFRGADGADHTEALLAALPPELRACTACCEVFAASKGGAQAMAADMGVPFLGRVPLDPALSRAAEAGQSLQDVKSAGSLQAFNSIVQSAHLATCGHGSAHPSLAISRATHCNFLWAILLAAPGLRVHRRVRRSKRLAPRAELWLRMSGREA